jgi:exodeoxyribonuclease VII large subunit
VGLITSDGSAAYHDFVEELKASGYAFSLRFLDARMQGVETETDVPRALAVLEKDPDVDVIALIRGGGSRSDLIWFDKERVALAIARCGKPVLTGIGHEIDLSVADLVAHTSRKTPTAVAQFLVEAVRAFETALADSARRAKETMRGRLERENRLLAEAARAWRERTGAYLARFGEALSRGRELLRGAARRHVTVERERLLSAPGRLTGGVRSFLKSQTERLAGFRRECDLRDPRRLLARGYSLIYAGGRVAKSVKDVRVGEFIEARLHDGLLTANVLALQKEK